MKLSCDIHLLNPLASAPKAQCKPRARQQAAKMLEKCASHPGKKCSDQLGPATFA
jgi:hypothetical protein